jgi:hypothetical protein
MTDVDTTGPRLEITGAFQGLHSGLIFEILEVGKDGMSFGCGFYKGGFQGSVVVWTQGGASPSALFAEMARDWRGWEGTKVWEDLEQILTLKASSDRTGHITLHIEMRPQAFPYGEETLLTSSLMLDAGALETIARDIDRLFQTAVH